MSSDKGRRHHLRLFVILVYHRDELLFPVQCERILRLRLLVNILLEKFPIDEGYHLEIFDGHGNMVEPMAVIHGEEV